MTIPLHLTLTGRPLLLHAPVVPEMQSMLAQAYSDRAGRLADRAHRRGANKPSLLKSVFGIGSALPDPEDVAASAYSGDIAGLAATHPAARLPLASRPATSMAEPYLAQITIHGPLLNRAEILCGELCVDGYDRITADIEAAMADPACLGIFLDIDSPGGMVNGCFELSDRIRDWSADKPIVAFTDGLACSAAYAVACAATELHGALTAMIGSIGVIYGRLDTSARDADKGLATHFFTTGTRKAFGHPELALGEQELAETQAEIDKLGAMFFDRVAIARGLTVDAVRDLQAGYFLTDDAIAHGLADSQMTRAAALARLADLAATPPASADNGPHDVPADPAPADAGAGGGSKPKSAVRPTARRRPAKPNGSSPIDPPDQSASSPAGMSPVITSTAKETPMSIKTLRARASLSALLCASAASIAMAETPGLDRTALTAAVETETDETVAAMDDEDVDAMTDDEDTDAMEEEAEDEDEPVEAASDEDMDAAEDDESEDAPSARVVATRIARKATAAVTAGTQASAKPKRRKAAKAAKTDAIDPATAQAIQGLKEANGREQQAAALSITPGMTVDNAQRILAASGKATGSRLAGVPDPNIGSSGSGKPKVSAFEQAQIASAASMHKRAGHAA